MRRRDLFRYVLAASAAGASNFLSAQKSEDIDYEEFRGPPPEYQLYGTNPPTQAELVKARTLLDGAPPSTRFLEVATYFEQLADKNAEGELYRAQWGRRWNPVIVGFLERTNLNRKYLADNGDLVDWCAAFLNWCLDYAGCVSTGSPMSGSFRLGKALGRPRTNDETPEPGDIIVFRRRDPAQAKVGRGHVGIFIEKTSTGYVVLGGNQRAGKRYSSVNRTEIHSDHPLIEFDSFRAVDSITRKRG